MSSKRVIRQQFHLITTDARVHGINCMRLFEYKFTLHKYGINPNFVGMENRVIRKYTSCVLPQILLYPLHDVYEMST